MVANRYVKFAVTHGARALLASPILFRAILGHPISIPLARLTVKDEFLFTYVVAVLIVCGSQVLLSLRNNSVATTQRPGSWDIPEHACYYCLRRPGFSKCGGCRLVFYCGRMCQLQAWRKHRHVCGAATAASERVQGNTRQLTPSQWRELTMYTDFVQKMLEPTGPIPAKARIVAGILRQMADYVRQNPSLLSRDVADSIWISAVSMRNHGKPDRLHMAWAWVFLEGCIESGTPDDVLAAMGLQNPGEGDWPRVSRWMRRGLFQSLLMLTRRSEVGEFIKAAPRISLD